MTGTKTSHKIGDLVVTQPFRVIEMLVSLPMALYGVYLIVGIHAEDYGVGAVYSLSINPELNAEISGILFLMAGAAMFVAARSGVRKAREVSTMAFFFTMLWSVMFRAFEVGFLPGSVLMFYMGLVVAGVDFAQLRSGRTQ